MKETPPEPPSATTEARSGFPAFEHNQWTVEGEIERMGAFGSAGAKARGWRRGVAVAMALLLVVPLIINVVLLIVRAGR